MLVAFAGLSMDWRPPTTALIETPAAAFDLLAKRVDERLVLHWNPAVAPLADVEEARVFIRDRGLQTSFPLDRTALQSGQLTYDPESGTVDFTIEAKYAGKRLLATLTVIDPSR